MKIDLILMSKLGLNDGGRETWFFNFLNEIKKDGDDLQITTISLPIKEKLLFTRFIDSNIIKNTIEVDVNKAKVIPLSIAFIIKASLKIWSLNKRSTKVVAVGGLYEMLTCLFSYPPIIYDGKKIAWLRTISHLEISKESKLLTKFLKEIELFLLKNYFDLVLVNGVDAYTYYKEFGIEPIVINNGIPIDKWYKPISTNVVEKPLTIAFIGRLSKVKGIVNFMNAIKLYNDKQQTSNNDIRFLVVGSGKYYDLIESNAQEFNIELLESVPNDQIPKILDKVDVCVALTFFSPTLGGCGLSNALLEQMCSGKLIIAWDNQIFTQILDKSNSILIEQNNDKGLADSFNFISNRFNELIQYRVNSQNKSLLFTSNMNKNLFIESLQNNDLQ